MSPRSIVYVRIDGPRANFATFVEWTLWTQRPTHHLPAAQSGCPSPQGTTEPWIAAEPILLMTSVQLHEPVTTPAPRENAKASDVLEGSSAHCNMAEGELVKELGEWKAEEDLIDLASLRAQRLSNAHPLPPAPLPLPLSSVSPSAHPQSSICAVGLPRVCQLLLALWLEDPLSLPPASESRTPPRPFDPAAPPWPLVLSSPPWPGSPLAPLDSLVTPAPSWSGIDHPAPRDSTPPASPHPSGSVWLLHPSGSTLVLCRSASTAVSRMHGSVQVRGATCSTLVLQILPVTLDLWLSVPASGSYTTCSAAFGRPPGVVSPASSMVPPSVGSTVAITMAVAWVMSGSSCSKSLLSSFWLLPLSGPPWFLLFPSWFLPPSSALWTLFVILLPDVRSPPEPSPEVPLREDALSGKGAIMSHPSSVSIYPSLCIVSVSCQCLQCHPCVFLCWIFPVLYLLKTFECFHVSSLHHLC
ncbi:Triple functional domain protein [Labeo rohita]|uniref:Triple functional domain protein n=1 Tax=Labeo rohita TaxID=84645 RepID=A0ABQ8LSK1_LABRO|nr:Triple functional domain protein [Labeo rohita]